MSVRGDAVNCVKSWCAISKWCRWFREWERKNEENKSDERKWVTCGEWTW